MNRELIIDFAQTINIITKISATVIDEETNEIVAMYALMPKLSKNTEIDDALKDKYANIVQMEPDHYIGYYISEDLLGFGKVRSKDTALSIMVGPCRLADISKGASKRMLNNPKFVLDDPVQASNDIFFNFLQTIPRVTPLYFLWVLTHVNTAVNQEIIHPETFISTNPFFNQADMYVENRYIYKQEFFPEEFESADTVVDTYSQLLAYVREGDIENVNKYWHASANNVKTTLPMYINADLRQEKNQFISLTSIVGQACIEEGLPNQTIFVLSNTYISRAEGAVSREEFANLYPSMLNDFTSRIHDLKTATQDRNYMVQRAINYINTNITRRIHVNDIADSLKISPGYMSSLFKDSMGMYINDYINKRKIEESKKLLEHTDKSLSDISLYFSFSSQSYFQNIFKKFTGMTPTEYRKTLKRSPARDN